MMVSFVVKLVKICKPPLYVRSGRVTIYLAQCWIVLRRKLNRVQKCRSKCKTTKLGLVVLKDEVRLIYALASCFVAVFFMLTLP